MTHHISAMLDAYPKDPGGIDKHKLAGCIAACFQCAQACTACADACLGEDTWWPTWPRASVRIWTARTSVSRRATFSPAAPVMTPASPGPYSKPAGPPARPARRNAIAMPACTHTAGSALSRAADARPPARNSWQPWRDQPIWLPLKSPAGRAASCEKLQRGLQLVHPNASYRWGKHRGPADSGKSATPPPSPWRQVCCTRSQGRCFLLPGPWDAAKFWARKRQEDADWFTHWA